MKIRITIEYDTDGSALEDERKQWLAGHVDIADIQAASEQGDESVHIRFEEVAGGGRSAVPTKGGDRTMWHVIARQCPDENETVEYWTGASWSISRIKAFHWGELREAWEKCQELGEEAEVWGIYSW